MNRKSAIVFFMCAIAGCVSVPEANYYTLDLRSSGTNDASFAIAAMRIRASEAVSRREIMIRATPTQVEYYATHLWAAGLDEQVAEKLKAELGGPTEGAATEVAIVGELLAFEQVDTASGADGHVKLELRVSRSPADSTKETVITKVYEAWVTAGERSAPAVVEALSAATEQIARDIAADLARLQ